MTICPSCGRESHEAFKFCPECGAAIAAPPQRELRKVVTIVFCDLTGSTAMGDRTDPETLRATMRGYYAEMRVILERHGGTVEKFVGDAVMAVFGVPVAHEDDALRAVRAAWEMREAVPRLGLRARIGVNSGEVVASEGDTLVTGDAVNVAARLEQAAEPGEILIGERTRGLVRDAVSVEAAEVDAKGKQAPVFAFRLIDIDLSAEAVLRRLDSPLVGRARERARVLADFERVRTERGCHLFTLLGVAGVGKSRLVLDFVEHAEARIVRSRCLDYGEGSTLSPLNELALQLGEDPLSVIGESNDDTSLAFRRMLERHASEEPLVVVLEDLHWAEPTFLDVVEHTAIWSREAPILLVCVARPELLDSRPNWGGGMLNSTSILLEPLRDDETTLLLDNLLSGMRLETEVRARIIEAAQGNPLFIEEMVAMAREGGAAVSVPPTIQALLQARLDGLDAGDRAVMEHGAIEGEIFHRSAVVELASLRSRPDVPKRLLSLVRKELIRPSDAPLLDDDAFRFRHLLIRDAAYDALPKRTRADLHERFALWMDEHVQLVEQAEVVGYHLEQAALYRAELGSPDARLEELAAQRLAGATFAAAARGDWAAIAKLGARAWRLSLPESSLRAELALPLVTALQQIGDHAAAAVVVSELPAAGPLAAGYAQLFAEEIARHLGRSDTATPDLEALAELFERPGGELGRALLARRRAYEGWLTGHLEDAARHYLDASRHAADAGNHDLSRTMKRLAISAMLHGPTPLSAVEELLDDGEYSLRSRAAPRVRIAAMRGRFEEANEMIAKAQQETRETGQTVNAWGLAQSTYFIAVHSGDRQPAIASLEASAEGLGALGERDYLSTVLMQLAHLYLAEGRRADSDAAAFRSREVTMSDDVVNVAGLAALQALAAALDGDATAAEESLRDAFSLSEQTDFVELRTFVRMRAAEAYQALGRADDAKRCGEEAIAILDAKEDFVLADRVRAMLVQLDGSSD